MDCASRKERAARAFLNFTSLRRSRRCAARARTPSPDQARRSERTTAKSGKGAPGFAPVMTRKAPIRAIYFGAAQMNFSLSVQRANRGAAYALQPNRPGGVPSETRDCRPIANIPSLARTLVHGVRACPIGSARQLGGGASQLEQNVTRVLHGEGNRS